MNLYQTFLRPILFELDPERVHDGAIRACELLGSLPITCRVLSACCGFTDPRLETEVCGTRFSNHVGLAAGYDKNGRAIEAMAAMGFGHVEIGSISADPSDGNPKPRLFRLPRDGAIIVHYGLPNEGAEAVAARLASRRFSVPLGINIVKTNRGLDAPPDSDDEIIDDYVRSLRVLKDVGDYLTINLSCPNTEMGRNFFAEPRNITRLLSALEGLGISRPVFLKVAPGGAGTIEDLLAAVEGVGLVSGFIFNLPPGKPDTLTTPRRFVASMPGAVSGKPVELLINKAIRELYLRMDRDRYRIIGAGGVFSAEDAYRKIRLGASLVQLVTGLIYEGPDVVRRINQGLCRLLERDGFAHVAQAVGTADER